MVFPTPKVRAVFPGILLISAATLLLEIAWMRVLSVTLWYHFAFMVLSTALFGFGFAFQFSFAAHLSESSEHTFDFTL